MFARVGGIAALVAGAFAVEAVGIGYTLMSSQLHVVALIVTYSALAMGLLRDRAWAPWFALGVATHGATALISWLLRAPAGVGWEGWAFAGAHVVLAACWIGARPTHWRMALCWTAVGAALVPAARCAADAVITGHVVSGVLAAALLAASAVGVARQRVVGLIALGAAASVFAMWACMHHAGVVWMISGGQTSFTVIAGLLCAAALPFAGPAWRMVVATGR